VADRDGIIWVRDSKDRDKAPHRFTPAGWRAFIASVQAPEPT
jgi:hypothetical protein